MQELYMYVNLYFSSRRNYSCAEYAMVEEHTVPSVQSKDLDVGPSFMCSSKVAEVVY